MRIGLAQMNTQADKQNNLDCAVSLIDKLVAQKASLIVLPEYFNYLGPEASMAENAEVLKNSSSLERIREKARQHHIHIHIGSFLERDGEDVFNTGVVFSPGGDVLAMYRKIHLFDVEIPGGRRYLESEIITPGETIATFTIEGTIFGMSTCYDLRFPEMFRRLVELGAEVILLPAAFTLETGRDHWELLLRARAVENLCWVAAVDQCGTCPPSHRSYGRSMVIDPWGVVVAQASDGVTAFVADIDLALQRDIRGRFPALNHIKKHLFSA